MPEHAIKKTRAVMYGYWFGAMVALKGGLFGSQPYYLADQIKKNMSTVRLLDLVSQFHAASVVKTNCKTVELANALIDGVATMYGKPESFVDTWQNLVSEPEKTTRVCTESLGSTFNVPFSAANFIRWQEIELSFARHAAGILKDSQWESHICEAEIGSHLQT